MTYAWPPPGRVVGTSYIVHVRVISSCVCAGYYGCTHTCTVVACSGVTDLTSYANAFSAAIRHTPLLTAPPSHPLTLWTHVRSSFAYRLFLFLPAVAPPRPSPSIVGAGGAGLFSPVRATDVSPSRRGVKVGGLSERCASTRYRVKHSLLSAAGDSQHFAPFVALFCLCCACARSVCLRVFCFTIGARFPKYAEQRALAMSLFQ